jgi:hypothetical protein
LHLTGHSISEFLLRPYQRAQVDHWPRPKPARMASFFTGADSWEGNTCGPLRLYEEEPLRWPLGRS